MSEIKAKKIRKVRISKTVKFSTINDIVTLFNTDPPYHKLIQDEKGYFTLKFIHPQISKKELIMNTFETEEKYANTYCNRLLTEKEHLASQFKFRLLTAKQTRNTKIENLSQSVN